MDVSFGENWEDMNEITVDSAAEQSVCPHAQGEGGRGEDEFGKCQWG